MNKQQTVWSKNISLQQSRNWKLGHGVTYVKRPQYDLLKGFSQRKIIACRILQQWQDKKCFLESVPIPLFSLAWTEVQVKLFYTAIGQFPVINKIKHLRSLMKWYSPVSHYTAPKMKFFNTDFFSKSDQILNGKLQFLYSVIGYGICCNCVLSTQ